jgi:hypothetical protein
MVSGFWTLVSGFWFLVVDLNQGICENQIYKKLLAIGLWLLRVKF